MIPSLLLYPCPPLSARLTPSGCAANKARLEAARRAPKGHIGSRIDCDTFAACATCPGVLALAGEGGELRVPEVRRKRPFVGRPKRPSARARMAARVTER